MQKISSATRVKAEKPPNEVPLVRWASRRRLRWRGPMAWRRGSGGLILESVLTSQVCFDSVIPVIRLSLRAFHVLELMKGSFCGSIDDFLPGSGTDAATRPHLRSPDMVTVETCHLLHAGVRGTSIVLGWLGWAPPRHQQRELTPPDNSPEWGSNLRRSARARTPQNSQFC